MVRGPDGPRRQKARADSFTARKQRRFLDALAATCNVRAAALEAGVDRRTIYRHRASDDAFYQAWEQALDIAYDRLEWLMLEQGGAAEPLAPPDPAAAEARGVATPDFDKAYKIMAMYLKKRARDGGRAPQRGRAATREETNAALLKSLETARRRAERAGRDDR